ncbi:unnamed protein product [Nezara viridula]|uniref:Neuropeptide n=1 Tax=Nezara viridula TaxID=85310 RepID=A0A9P0E7P7_NEZVI|nr:unnamed protein product [Nezara viridula]
MSPVKIVCLMMAMFIAISICDISDFENQPATKKSAYDDDSEFKPLKINYSPKNNKLRDIAVIKFTGADEKSDNHSIFDIIFNPPTSGTSSILDNITQAIPTKSTTTDFLLLKKKVAEDMDAMEVVEVTPASYYQYESDSDSATESSSSEENLWLSATCYTSDMDANSTKNKKEEATIGKNKMELIILRIAPSPNVITYNASCFSKMSPVKIVCLMMAMFIAISICDISDFENQPATKKSAYDDDSEFKPLKINYSPKNNKLRDIAVIKFTGADEKSDNHSIFDIIFNPPTSGTSSILDNITQAIPTKSTTTDFLLLKKKVAEDMDAMEVVEVTPASYYQYESDSDSATESSSSEENLWLSATCYTSDMDANSTKNKKEEATIGKNKMELIILRIAPSPNVITYNASWCRVISWMRMSQESFLSSNAIYIILTLFVVFFLIEEYLNGDNE